MKRINKLHDDSRFYISLIEILSNVKQPTNEQFDTINRAKEALAEKVEQINNDIDKLEKADRLLYKRFRLILTLLLIMFMGSTVVLACIIANKISSILAIIPLLLLTVIQITAILMLELNAKNIKVHLVLLALGIIVIIFAYLYDSTFREGSILAIALQFITIVNFIFGLYEKLKEKD